MASVFAHKMEPNERFIPISSSLNFRFKSQDREGINSLPPWFVSKSFLSMNITCLFRKKMFNIDVHKRFYDLNIFKV